MAKHDTPMLDELEKGQWPSFVTDIKRQAEKKTRMLGYFRPIGTVL